jgi:hypothetical protein
MRSNHKGLLFLAVAGLLFVCLACLEIPEMSTLTDDVSNDFTILIHGSSATQSVVCAKLAHTVTPQASASKRIDFSEFVAETATEEIAHPGSRDLLALHSLRRT